MEAFRSVVAKTVLAEMRCTVEFSVPAFDLANRTIHVLSALYDRISRHYPIDLADMRVLAGSAVSDLAVNVTMFGGNADVQVSAKDMTLTFRHIKSEQDIDICAIIMSASEKAIADSLSTAEMSNRLLSCTLSLELGDGKANAREHVSHMAALDSRLAVGDICGGICQPLINLEAINQDAGWRATFYAAPHRELDSTLIAGCSVEYDSTYTVETGVEHVHQLIDAFLDAAALEVDSLWNTVG